MTTSLEIDRMLTLSTSHVPQEIGAALDMLDMFPPPEGAEAIRAVIGYAYVYGWFIWCGQQDNLAGMPASIRACVELARAHDCLWIKFDRDGPVAEALPSYMW